jgi:hypothetical protein
MTPRRSPRPTARCLCASCGLRFSSTKAFDAHRSFAAGRKGDWGTRECLDSFEVDGLESINGVCNLTGEKIEGVHIWGLAEHRERARETFRKQERQAREQAARASQSNRGDAGRTPRANSVHAASTRSRRSELPAETGVAR